MAAPSTEVLAAFAEHEREIAIHRIRIGCLLAMTTLPLGALIDWQLYPPAQFAEFLVIRAAGSLLMLPFLLLVRHPFGARHHRVIGVVLAMFPASAMALIIHRADGASSPYYAGLNLVLLAVGLVLQWNLAQSLTAASLVILMYIAATASSVASDVGIFLNNLWFLLLTGIIVVVGNHIQSRLRRNEFLAAYALDQSRRELEESNRKLRELDEIKGRFFANISHELRTPLTLLLAPIESLQSLPALQQPSGRDQLATMQANGMRLLKLINDLLDLVRLDAGQMRLHKSPIDVPTFTRGVLNAVQSYAVDRGIRLQLTLDPNLPVLHADPEKLEKVLLNLLFNAIKFTAAGREIHLRALSADGEVVFEVQDQGVGIAEENLPNLFSRFWQADSSAHRKYQGAGLGLALVKELVEAHDGSVTVSSRVGHGTTMTVRLPSPPAALDAGKATAPLPPVPPAATQSPPDAPPAAATPSLPSPAEGDAHHDHWLANLYRRAELYASITPLRDTLRTTPPGQRDFRPRLVLADDEPDMLRFLKSQLQEHYEILDAVDGEQAVALVRQYLPDAVVCDMMMPEKDGIQVCRELAADDSTRTIPFLMVTARADDETKLQALGAGASDFIAKPFSLAELRVRVQNLVSRHQLQKEVARQNQRLTAALEQLRDTELQLVQSEKLASLGRMSAGILHEINNPLNFTKTGLYILARFETGLPEEERAEFRETLTDLNEGVSRVVRIVTDLRSFSHPQGGSVEMVPVAEIAASALRFLAAEWRDQVQVVNTLPDDLQVPAERNRLLQVLVNLLQNALDAVRSRDSRDDPPRIELHAHQDGDFHVLRIRDNGPGIPEANLARIFDPFFTTKDVGEGTGLGLSICHRIVHDWGGRIRVDTREGEFTEFQIELPTTPPPEQELSRETFPQLNESLP